MLYMLAVVLTVVFIGLRLKAHIQKSSLRVGPLVGEAVLCFAATMFLATVGSSLVVVEAGERGVIFSKLSGGIQPEPLGEGWHIVWPFVQKFTPMDIKTQKQEFATTAASKDLQDVRTKVTLNFNIIGEATPEIYQTVGLRYAEKIIAPAVQEIVKAVTARYTAEELITKRATVSEAIQTTITAQLVKSSIAVTGVFITDFAFSKLYSEAIEAKQVEEQEVRKAALTLKKVELVAQQELAKKRAEAEGLQLQKSAISTDLIELRKVEMLTKMVEKWDGQFPKFMSGQLPFMMMLDGKSMGLGDLASRK